MFSLSNALLRWYEKNKRELPWRQKNLPYEVWLSEIILQQTRVSQGLPYFLRFIDKHPHIVSLSEATENDVLKLWQGLGYYSRGRNLLKTAKIIATQHQGNFPKTYNELIKLPGIGDYTASAIASICFNQPTPVVDGNVKRVFSRLFAIKENIDDPNSIKTIKEYALKMMPKTKAGDFNQAIMELGALICLPKQPLCKACPFENNCIALKEYKPENFPFKKKRPKPRIRHFHHYIIIANKHALIHKRTDNDIWKNLYQFPLIEYSTNLSLKKQQTIFTQTFPFVKYDNIIDMEIPQTHILTHQKIISHIYLVETIKIHHQIPTNYTLFSLPEILKLPVSKLTERYLNNSLINILLE